MKEQQNQINLLYSTFIAVFIIAIAYYLIVRAKRLNSQNEVFQGDDPTTGQNPSYLATLIHQAVNPSGIGLLINVDGTDEQALFSISRQIKNFTQVAQKYNDLYRRNLSQDLESELGQEDFNTFRSLLGKGNVTTSPPTPKPVKYYCKSNNTKAYAVQKNSNGAYSSNFSLVKTYKANELVSDTAPIHFLKINQSGNIYSVFKGSSFLGLSTTYFMVLKDLIVQK